MLKVSAILQGLEAISEKVVGTKELVAKSMILPSQVEIALLEKKTKKLKLLRRKLNEQRPIAD